jgi:hypothetical protein
VVASVRGTKLSVLAPSRVRVAVAGVRPGELAFEGDAEGEGLAGAGPGGPGGEVREWLADDGGLAAGQGDDRHDVAVVACALGGGVAQPFGDRHARRTGDGRRAKFPADGYQ